jgi:predicted DNA binding CopG/RHH family protein
MRRKLPEFSSEAEEREFWAREDSTAYIDWSRAKRAVLPGLKPSVKVISLRLPDVLLAELKVLANKRDVPYQSLLKMFLAERIAQELQDREPHHAGPVSSPQRARKARR